MRHKIYQTTSTLPIKQFKVHQQPHSQSPYIQVIQLNTIFTTQHPCSEGDINAYSVQFHISCYQTPPS